MNTNLGRLDEVLNQIEDPDINKVIREVFNVEISYRSMEAKNFPRNKIREIIEDAARVKENQP